MNDRVAKGHAHFPTHLANHGLTVKLGAPSITPFITLVLMTVIYSYSRIQ